MLSKKGATFDVVDTSLSRKVSVVEVCRQRSWQHGKGTEAVLAVATLDRQQLRSLVANPTVSAVGFGGPNSCDFAGQTHDSWGKHEDILRRESS